MTDLSRRRLITGLIAFAAAPAIVRATSIMPVKLMQPTDLLRVYVDPLELRVATHEWLDSMMGGLHFKTIREAVDYVQSMGSPESEIMLAAGYYNENVGLPYNGDHTLIISGESQ
jgi:hypothetical protein